MSQIVIADNRKKDVSDEDGEFLCQFSDKSLPDLRKEHPDWIICGPQNFGSKRQKQSEGKSSQKIWSYHEAGLSTYNIAGMLGNGGTTVAIHSRFDTQDKQHFLHYMLAKVFSPTVLKSQLKHEPSSVLDFLPYLLLPWYQKAYHQYGLYREYRSRQCNDARPQGRLDIARHIRENMPFASSICYTKRLQEYDNRITRLLAHTLAYVQRRYYLGARLESQNPELREPLQELKRQVPQAADLGRVQQVLRASEKPIRSPYASGYEDLRKLCRAILQRQKIELQGKAGQVHGILFDVAWLWEEYLARLLPNSFTHAYSRSSGGHKIFASGQKACIYPDFYNKASDASKAMVLDAKYKRLGGKNPAEDNRNDFYQMLSYMYILQAKKAILLYPTEETEPNNFLGKLNGYGGSLETYGLSIPQQAKSFADFISGMEKTEHEFKRKIEKEMESQAIAC